MSRSGRAGRRHRGGRPVEGLADPSRFRRVRARIGRRHRVQPTRIPLVVGALGGGAGSHPRRPGAAVDPDPAGDVLLLGLGGLGALRHASFAGADASWLLVIWAAATMLALVLVDRADAETVPRCPVARPAEPGRRDRPRIGRDRGDRRGHGRGARPTVSAPRPSRVAGSRSATGATSRRPVVAASSDELDLTAAPPVGPVVFTVDARRRTSGGARRSTYTTATTWTRSRPRPEHARPRGRQVEGHARGRSTSAPSGHRSARRSNGGGILRCRVRGTRARRGRDRQGLEQTPRRHGRRPVAGFGKGAVYTVTSRSAPVTGAKLRAADAHADPARDPRAVHAAARSRRPGCSTLAREITAGAPTTYDKMRAIETGWARTQYSSTRRSRPAGSTSSTTSCSAALGWCEQIASSLVVLARSVGHPGPARHRFRARAHATR